MGLHNLTPAAGSVKSENELVEDKVQAVVEHPRVDTKELSLVLVIRKR